MLGRREFVRSTALFALIAACNPGALFAPRRCDVAIEAPPLPAPQLRDVYIVSDYTGVQAGTRDQPYSASSAAEFDALLQRLSAVDDLAVHFTGRFGTAAVYRWGGLARRNLGEGWTVDGDAEVSIDPNAIPDAAVDGQPLFVFAGAARSVSGVTTVGNHSALADRWKAKGQSLRTGGVLLYGAGRRIAGTTFRRFGAIGAETFVAEVVGSGDIVDNVFTEHDPSNSDNQVTVYRTIGSENGDVVSAVPSLHARNTTNAPGSRLVQAHTIYQSPGIVRGNRSIGADVFYYGDYFRSRAVTIDDNGADACIHGVQLRLSQTPLPEAATFSHEDYRIGRNRFASSGAQVSLDTSGPPTASRFIRDISIDSSLTVENVDNGATEVSRRAYPDCRMVA